ncbi:DUF262 domain-containing protein [Vagococcus fluvialis]|uniref:DUF262 domain-containing protein n=1 Tax=Vagococcus fluvialis TaxID=2738 RepID=UPI003B220B83
MDNDLMSISDLFNRSIYRIPDYQRGYAWEAKEVADFWEDLEILSHNRLHYGGVLTLEKVKEEIYENWSQDSWLFNKRAIKAYYIVDGQQRLTTAMILLSVIINIVKEKYPEQKLDENVTISELEKKYILETNNNELNKTYLFSYDKENDSYNYYLTNILKQKSTDSRKKISENKYTKNLQNAYNYFYERCENLLFEDLDKLYCKLVYKFVFNRYVINSKLDIFVTFETMNNRGRNLSQLELLKNRLIYLTTLYDTDSGTKSEMRDKINDCWKSLYSYLGRLSDDALWNRRPAYRRNNLDLDDIFLQAQITSYNKQEFAELLDYMYETESGEKKLRRINIGDLLKRVFTAKNVMDNKLTLNSIDNYICDLSNSIVVWSSMQEPDLSDFDDEFKENIMKIRFLLKNFNYYEYAFRFENINNLIESTIFRMIKENESDLDEVLKTIKSLEKILFLINFLPNLDSREEWKNEKSESIYIFLNILIKANIETEFTNSSILEINREFQKIIRELSTLLKKVSSELKNSKAYNDNKNISYYILLEYEIYLMKQSKNLYQFSEISTLYSSKSDLNLEHIYPKNGRNKYWADRFGYLSDNNKDKFKHSLGNLIIISKEKNIGLGNKEYPLKVDNKSINKPLGYKYGGYAEKYLVSEYEEWTPISIENRGKVLLDFIQKRWNIRLDKKIYNDILGLPSVIKIDEGK